MPRKKHGWIRVALVALTFFGVCVAPSDGEERAYVAVRGDDSLVVIDSSTISVVGGVTLPPGSGPEEVCVRPDGRRLFVFNGIAHSMSVIEAASLRVTATLPISPVTTCRFHPDGERLFVRGGQGGASYLRVIDASTNNQLGSLWVRSGSPGLSIHPDGDEVYVAEPDSDRIRVVDADTLATTDFIEGVGTALGGIVVHPDGQKLYVTEPVAQIVTVADIPSRTIAATVPLGVSPRDLDIHPSGGTLYVASLSGVTVIDTASSTELAFIPITGGTSGIGLTGDGGALYVPSGSTGFIHVIDTATNSLISSLGSYWYPNAPYSDFLGIKPRPAYSCSGFAQPFDLGPVTSAPSGKPIVLRARLLDQADNPVTAADIMTPPMAQVLFDSAWQAGEDPLDVSTMPSPNGGLEGNQFTFTEDGEWLVRLKLKYHTAPGSYSIFMESGNDAEYSIDPTCWVTFVRE